MDYRIYRAINRFAVHHVWLAHPFAAVEKWSVPAFAGSVFALWLLAPPGGAEKWKLASLSAPTAAVVALVVNRLVTVGWQRPRPVAAHPSAHLFVGRSHDASFPSDHASAAFAIAFAVLLFDRLVGAILLVAATLVGMGRVVVGAHYPSDVAAGAAVGLAAALAVVRVGTPLIRPLVSVIERATDPLARPVWRVLRKDAPPT